MVNEKATVRFFTLNLSLDSFQFFPTMDRKFEGCAALRAKPSPIRYES
jgi:hypothetical protein